MTDQEKAIKIISELNLTLVQVGELLGCSWQAVQSKKSEINGNRFTESNIETLEKYLEQKKQTLNNI